MYTPRFYRTLEQIRQIKRISSRFLALTVCASLTLKCPILLDDWWLINALGYFLLSSHQSKPPYLSNILCMRSAQWKVKPRNKFILLFGKLHLSLEPITNFIIAYINFSKTITVEVRASITTSAIVKSKRKLLNANVYKTF